MKTTHWLDEVQWNDDGLVTAIAQDHKTAEVLMLAWMNRESLELTLKEQVAIYWSRSRGRLWRKGESSGHTQRLVECRLDCDGDAILLKVEQTGGIACHTGRKSCFYRRLSDNYGDASWDTEEPVLQDPATIYGHQ
ncbi:phosphoribosyl-AMP cyclohydrolase [Endozoicomonas sp. GU-1]|uniref:phosphoribosyl-AMP cyclohydrolase n=1 Tax=Endozoicomonas sp. GU-1 TaxID=3009078 RepID=UPI0022B2FCF4|nr:phosphoribosyl-AMP cyclohydrolase [Endozoicomonas sp. GU-1]WBA82961.1 phosphoribosyl-AMP cyclohydrolase [Endozoicomonas sp. GU-1]WBA85887.1 phosphoribosyl-AMP cyclohydrolase [Endozoicomonas sp. GU-1]